MIVFLGNPEVFPFSNLFPVEFNNINMAEKADLVIATEKALFEIKEKDLNSFSEKLVIFSDNLNFPVPSWKKLSTDDLTTLSPLAIKMLLENRKLTDKVENLENDLGIQDILQEELLYKQDEFDAVQHIALALSSHESFQKRILDLSKILVKFFKLEQWIFLLKEDLYFQVICASPENSSKPFIAEKGTLIDWISKNNMPIIVKNITHDLRFQGKQEVGYLNLPLLATPIINKASELLGIFILYQLDKDNKFSQTFAEQVNIFFSNVTPLIENAIIKEELERMYRVKSEFMANMTHELRTPLNGIIGFADILMLDELTAEQKDYALTIKESGNHLLYLINNILDMTKLEATGFSINHSETDVSKIIHQCINSFLAKAKQKDIEIKVGDLEKIPPVAFGDPLKIKQIILNITANAVKFTEKGSVTVSACAKSESHDRYELAISIKDTGIGIPKDKIAEIFEPFRQVDSGNTRKYEGTGLGLAISMKLIKLHGGDISVNSEEGKGTTFTFTLMLFKEQPERN